MLELTDFQYALLLMWAAADRGAGSDASTGSTSDYERQEQACPWLRDGRD